MVRAENGQQVLADFTVRTPDGVLVSQGVHRLTLGRGDVFRAIENAIIGMREDERKTLTLRPEDAFGTRRDDRVFRIPRSAFPFDDAPEEGMQLMGENEYGEPMKLTITEANDDFVTADGNHPLAGLDLQVTLCILSIMAE